MSWQMFERFWEKWGPQARAMGHGPYVRHCQSKGGTSEHQGFDPQAFVCPKSLSHLFQGPKIIGWPSKCYLLHGIWGGVLDFEIYPICFLVMCLFHHVPLFFGSCSGMWEQQSGTCGWWEGTTSYVACPGNAKRHPNDGRRPSAVSRRELLGRSGCSYWSSRPPKKWLVDRCTVSDWMSRVALHIGQIQIHDSTVRMIQNSSNLYKRRIVLRTWAPSQEEEISSTNKFSIDPLLCEEAYVW